MGRSSVHNRGMTEPLAYFNGELLPYSAVGVPLHDAGFVLGATVTDQLRTFRGRIYRFDEHLARLERSLAILGVAPPLAREDWSQAAEELVEHNRALTSADDDLGLAIFVTPGPYATLAGDAERRPTVGMHTYLLPFHLWADKYQTGQPLVTTPVEQVPAACWPPELKCRSRMHYYLAERAAQQIEPGSRALLLQADGAVSETATANIVIHRAGEGLAAPRRETVLPGISLAALVELSGQLGIPCTERDLTLDDVLSADEVMLTSTPSCVLPVCQVNSRTIGAGPPGRVFTGLLTAWSESVGLDIAAQARKFASRG